jgi:DNA-binding NtrC family response regulator
MRRCGLAEMPVVIVVDDQAEVLQFVTTMLERGGFDVTPANCAEYALELLTARKADLLVSDVIMPEGMDGVDLALTAKELQPELAVLFISGFDEGRVERYRGNFGDAGFLEKPFGMVELLSAVQDALKLDHLQPV